MIYFIRTRDTHDWFTEVNDGSQEQINHSIRTGMPQEMIRNRIEVISLFVISRCPPAKMYRSFVATTQYSPAELRVCSGYKMAILTSALHFSQCFWRAAKPVGFFLCVFFWLAVLIGWVSPWHLFLFMTQESALRNNHYARGPAQPQHAAPLRDHPGCLCRLKVMWNFGPHSATHRAKDKDK